ncbi:hypothetical protein ACTXT7_005238 [Hymenolepis weldensis]
MTQPKSMSDRKRTKMRPIHSGDPFSPLSKKRKNIPGPLGMLSKSESNSKNTPKRKSTTSFSHESSNLSFSDCDMSLTQVDIVWDRVVHLFGPESWKIFTDYSIDKIVKSAEKAFPRGKIPVLCASVEKIDMALPIAKAILQDETGKIGCSIDKSVIHKYKKFFTIGAVLVLKQTQKATYLGSILLFVKISLFSLNHKTFYLNITTSNVTRVFLDEAALDSRLLANARILEDVTVCGPNFPLTHPPLSLEELKNLVAECSAPPSPPLAPSSPPIYGGKRRAKFRGETANPKWYILLVFTSYQPVHPLKSSAVALQSSVKSLNTSTPKQPKRPPSRHNTSTTSPPVQADRNWRLNSCPKSAAADSTPLAPNPSLPPRPRCGIRSILKNTLSTIPSTPNSLALTAVKLASREEKSDSHKGEFMD